MCTSMRCHTSAYSRGRSNATTVAMSTLSAQT